jgi:hypothetical protein
MVPVAVAGWRARAVVERSGGDARVAARLSRSLYLQSGGETLWLGPPGSPLHGRALTTPAPLPDAALDAVVLDLTGAQTWSAPALPAIAPGTLAAPARALLAALADVGVPEGFGVLLAGGIPAFPLDRVAGAARALAAACHGDDAEAAGQAARALVGCGGGLTPAGDDYVGAALFARALAAPATAAWAATVARVVGHARRTTHPISAVLLADLAEGHGHAALHALAAALATGAPLADAVGRARALVRIGHSSGWDMLAGLLGALGGPGAGAPRQPLG